MLDELSSFKNHTSQRFKALKHIRPQLSRVIGLTGTPTPNGLIDLWAQMYLIDQGQRLEPRIGSYRAKYFTEGRRSAQIVFDYKPRPNALQEIEAKLKDITLSMSKDDYLSLPECLYQNIYIDLSPSELKRYNQFKQDRITELQGEELTALSAGTLSGKLQQWANGAIYNEEHQPIELHSAKLEATLELVEQAQSPVLIAYSFRHDRDRLFDLLKAYQPRELNTPEDINDWNEGRIRVLIGHPASMGHGLNIQKGGNIILWFGLTWSLELYQQFNARLHRQGQSKPVVIYHLISRHTIDERILSTLSDKDATQSSILEAVKAEIYS